MAYTRPISLSQNEEFRKHIRTLRKRGMTLQQIGEALGFAPVGAASSVSNVLNGAYGTSMERLKKARALVRAQNGATPKPAAAESTPAPSLLDHVKTARASIDAAIDELEARRQRIEAMQARLRDARNLFADAS